MRTSGILLYLLIMGSVLLAGSLQNSGSQSDSLDADTKNKRSRLTVEINSYGLGIGFLSNGGKALSAGLKGGFGTDRTGYMLAAGPHFSEDGQRSDIFELFHGTFVMNYDFGNSFYLESGMRFSWLLHFSDAGRFSGGTFVGPYLRPMLGNDRVRVSLRILFGLFTDADASESGIYLSGPQLEILF